MHGVLAKQLIPEAVEQLCAYLLAQQAARGCNVQRSAVYAQGSPVMLALHACRETVLWRP